MNELEEAHAKMKDLMQTIEVEKGRKTQRNPGARRQRNGGSQGGMHHDVGKQRKADREAVGEPLPPRPSYSEQEAREEEDSEREKEATADMVLSEALPNDKDDFDHPIIQSLLWWADQEDAEVIHASPPSTPTSNHERTYSPTSTPSTPQQVLSPMQRFAKRCTKMAQWALAKFNEEDEENEP